MQSRNYRPNPINRSFLRILFALALVFATNACCHPDAKSVVEEGRDFNVGADDFRILERADHILASEAVWNRADTRDCPEDEVGVSLFCALHRASIDVLGAYDHRRAALQEVRLVIGERGKDYVHRLMGFNNDQATTFSDIKQVLRESLERLRKRNAL